MSAVFPTMLAVEEAERLLLEAAQACELAPRPVPLAQCLGLVLAGPVVAPFDVPAFRNAAMDGYALRHEDLGSGATLHLIGEQFAGRDRGLRVSAGECVRITTGAPLPYGSDTVVIKEHAGFHDGRVSVHTLCAVGANVREAGSVYRAGQTVLNPGARLHGTDLGALASLGLDAVEVRPHPTVAVFTTGDELRASGAALQRGEIHDSNGALLHGLLAAMGIQPLRWPALPDDTARIEAALADACASFDAVICCGGVSAGERDLLPELLARRARILFWKVRIKPGMPLLCARWERALLFCLPGNPVSVAATFLRFVQPALRRMQRCVDPLPRLVAHLDACIDKKHGRSELRRGRLYCSPEGELRVVPHVSQGSNELHSLVESNALIEIPESGQTLAADSLVHVLPYRAMLSA